jgi:drug/metabolite transporter (DMT)-like permease
MLVGTLAGLAAGALWGLIFIAPLAVAPYSGVDLAIGRYLVFAATSILVFAAIPASRAAGLSIRDALTGVALGMIGYGAYYGCLVVAVTHAGPQVSALVIGMLPVLLAVIGNLGLGRMPWRSLAVPLVLMSLGLLLVHGHALVNAETAQARGEIVFGILAALGSVGCWVFFSVLNARVLARLPGMNTLAWTSLHGLGAGAGILLFAALAFPFGLVTLPALGWDWPEIRPLLVWALCTGFFGSWIASYLWVVATKRLPLVISGQLFVGEPAFGMIYGFIWEGRWPTPPEAVGAACLFGGVMLGIAAFGRHRRAATERNLQAAL